MSAADDIRNRAKALLASEGYELVGQKSITFTGGVFWSFRGSRHARAPGKKRRAGLSVLECRYAVVTQHADGTTDDMVLVTKRDKELTESFISKAERGPRRGRGREAHTITEAAKEEGMQPIVVEGEA